MIPSIRRPEKFSKAARGRRHPIEFFWASLQNPLTTSGQWKQGSQARVHVLRCAKIKTRKKGAAIDMIEAALNELIALS